MHAWTVRTGTVPCMLTGAPSQPFKMGCARTCVLRNGSTRGCNETHGSTVRTCASTKRSYAVQRQDHLCARTSALPASQLASARDKRRMPPRNKACGDIHTPLLQAHAYVHACPISFQCARSCTMHAMFSCERGWNVMHSSMRLMNSRPKCSRTWSITRSRTDTRSSSAADGAKISALPRLDVMMMSVFLKLIVWPCVSVTRPSSRICSSTLKTSTCAFSISSKRTTL
mmetsp:Transcript_42787/g.128464  ORF Transcript_42787/g.128464 Transcript_42787/m.128464 type:complete len:228 (+) Transcript_42787:157-840(+)